MNWLCANNHDIALFEANCQALQATVYAYCCPSSFLSQCPDCPGDGAACTFGRCCNGLSCCGGQPIPPGVDPLPEPELDAQSVALVNAFIRFLAPPAPPNLKETAKQGRALFSKIGCDGCHVPRFKTGPSDVAALAYREVEAYSDLLLHDMGSELADICLSLASPSEFRTEPLMGLRFSTKFLHDGRATSLEEAIRLHGGESTAARDRFAALPPPDRAAVLAFLKEL